MRDKLVERCLEPGHNALWHQSRAHFKQLVKFWMEHSPVRHQRRSASPAVFYQSGDKCGGWSFMSRKWQQLFSLTWKHSNPMLVKFSAIIVGNLMGVMLSVMSHRKYLHEWSIKNQTSDSHVLPWLHPFKVTREGKPQHGIFSEVFTEAKKREKSTLVSCAIKVTQEFLTGVCFPLFMWLTISHFISFLFVPSVWWLRLILKMKYAENSQVSLFQPCVFKVKN